MAEDQIQWKSTREHFGKTADIITEFTSDLRSRLSGYTNEDVELVVPLVKGDIVYLKQGDEAIPESYRNSLRQIREPSSVDSREEEDEEEEEEFYQTRDSLVDMTTKSALLNMTGMDALMLGNYNEGLLNLFSNGIYAWYRDDLLFRVVQGPLITRNFTYSYNSS